MSSTGIPWEQEPDYIAACRTQIQPGEPSAYFPPRLTGSSPTDVTGFQIGSAYWNVDNLPSVCYVLSPPTEWEVFRKSSLPAQKSDEAGQLMWERHPWPGTLARPLLDFPILRNISTISTQVGWEWLEFMMRLDPRLGWDDIDMRMEYVGARAAYDSTIDRASDDVAKQVYKAKSKFVNALQTRCSRGRAAFKMLSWRERPRTGRPNKTRDHVLNQLSADQIANNTTRGSTPGIINPLLPDTPANRVSRTTQSQPSTPPTVQSDVQSGPSARIPAASQQNRPSSTCAEALSPAYIHQTAPTHLDRLRVPLTIPSTQTSRKRSTLAISSPPLVINDTARMDDEPLELGRKRAQSTIIDLTQDNEMHSDAESHLVINDTARMDNEPLTLGRKRAKSTIIDLTQDAETHSDAESFPSNYASSSTPHANTKMHTSSLSSTGANIVRDTHFNKSPTDIFNRRSNLSSSFPSDPLRTAVTPTTISQSLLEPEIPTEQDNATVNNPNRERGWDVYYHHEELAPWTEVGQEYLDWRSTFPGHESDPF